MNLRFSIYCLIVLPDWQIAPIIHEWTYDAMCHDLLNMEGNKYVYEVEKKFIYLFLYTVCVVLHEVALLVLFWFWSERHIPEVTTH